MRRDPRDQDSRDIRKVMNGIAHQSDGMTKVATEEFRRYQRERGQQCSRKKSGGELFVCMRTLAAVHVHESHSTSHLRGVYRMCLWRASTRRPDLGLSRSRQPPTESHLTSPQTGA